MYKAKAAAVASVFLAMTFGAFACEVPVDSAESLTEKSIYMPPSKGGDGYVNLRFNNRRQPVRFEIYRASDCKKIAAGEVASSGVYKTFEEKKYTNHTVEGSQGEAISADFSYVVRVREVKKTGLLGGVELSVSAEQNKDSEVMRELVDIFALRKDYYPEFDRKLESVVNKVSLENRHLRGSLLRSVRDVDGVRTSKLVVGLPNMLSSIAKVAPEAGGELRKVFAKNGAVALVAPELHKKIAAHEVLLAYRDDLSASKQDDAVAKAIKRYISINYDPEGLIAVAENRIKPYLYQAYLNDFRSASGSEDSLSNFISEHKRKDYDKLVPRAEKMLGDLVAKRKIKEREAWVAQYRYDFSAARTVSQWGDFIYKYSSDDPEKRIATARVRLGQALSKEYDHDFRSASTSTDWSNFVNKYSRLNYDPKDLIPDAIRFMKEAQQQEAAADLQQINVCAEWTNCQNNYSECVERCRHTYCSQGCEACRSRRPNGCY